MYINFPPCYGFAIRELSSVINRILNSCIIIIELSNQINSKIINVTTFRLYYLYLLSVFNFGFMLTLDHKCYNFIDLYFFLRMQVSHLQNNLKKKFFPLTFFLHFYSSPFLFLYFSEKNKDIHAIISHKILGMISDVNCHSNCLNLKEI